MTAEAQINNNATGMFENILLFFDSGLQCSFIQADMANTLALEKRSPYQCTMSGIHRFHSKTNAIDLDEHYNIAVGRLKALFKYNDANRQQKQWYTAILDDYLAADIVAKAHTFH
ncbi:hypothetical protein OESDEN_09379 [Oesophagostomum dentatum]|uniref:Uncharacterized protein n=1 Tax=Oesophagostomum dentatum TaxID=61180 RepID=A0A0B1T4Q1_OESDE|nr:hypothetical protein OESDEN_09379 [Oesophagostomum dentatum]